MKIILSDHFVIKKSCVHHNLKMSCKASRSEREGEIGYDDKCTAVRRVTSYGLDTGGVGVQVPVGLFRMALGSMQPPVQRIPINN
jgi:hypothetical protein